MILSDAIQRIKRRSKIKKIKFDIDKNWLKNKIINGRCEVTNIKFNLDIKKVENNPFYPSIDRITPSKGYTKDNCKLVIWAYNVLKADHTVDEVKKFAEGFIKYYEGLKQ
jgi:hypothetical protein